MGYYKPCAEQAAHWYREAARQGHDLAIRKCSELNIDL